MFGNKSKSIKTLGQTIESFQTMVGEATEIHGRLVASESLRIDGKVIGNVETSQDGVVSIAVGKNGLVQGDIYAYRVIIAGRVEGNVYCTERVELHNGSVVHGDVTYGINSPLP
ncbi:MAG: polymer-forming cytoskeletal protein [Burkholderiaceae bacterium]|nr:polymer-forming cytoskeletal protein [Burkholderiaceae bacterium]